MVLSDLAGDGPHRPTTRGSGASADEVLAIIRGLGDRGHVPEVEEVVAISMEVTAVRGVLGLGLDPSPELRKRWSSRLGVGDRDLGLEPSSKEFTEVRKCLHDLVKTKKGRREPYLCRRRRLTAAAEGVRRNCPCRRPGAKEIVWLGQ